LHLGYLRFQELIRGDQRLNSFARVAAAGRDSWVSGYFEAPGGPPTRVRGLAAMASPTFVLVMFYNPFVLL
jgi:hypothetical protein